MSAQAPTDAMIAEAIKKAIKQRVREIIEDEAKKAQEQISKRIQATVDQITLSVFSQFEITSDERQLVIRVRKDV